MKRLAYLTVSLAVVCLIVASCEKSRNPVDSLSSDQSQQRTLNKAGQVELNMCVSYDSDTETMISCIVEFNGRLYAGTYSNAHIYEFDGINWTLNHNFSSESQVWSLAIYNNKLYAGTEPGGHVYEYDGTSWSLSFDSPEYHVNSMAPYAGKLYAGTYKQGKIYVFDGNNWQLETDVFTILGDPNISPQSGYSSHVFALQEYTGKLYAGTTVHPGNDPYSPLGGLVFVYDGSSWSLAFDSDQQQIRSFAVYNDQLYAGTGFYGVIYNFDGSSWGVTYDDPYSCTVFSLAEYNGNLYAATNSNLDGVIYGFDGSQWVTAFDSPETGVRSLAYYANNFYAGTYSNGQIYRLCQINVDIDIKPGSYPNSFNPDGNGVIPVAILGSADFDVRDVDPGSVALEGLGVKVAGKSNKLLAHYEDVNNDNIEDLVVQIEDEDNVFEPGEQMATLTGLLYNGTPIIGTDSINIVP